MRWEIEKTARNEFEKIIHVIRLLLRENESFNRMDLQKIYSKLDKKEK